MGKHPLDQWESEAEKSQQDYREQCLRDTSLVFQVFSTEAGKQLVSRWKEVLISQPTAYAGADMLEVGINEGHKAFIRNILNAIKQHEENL